MSPFRKSTTVNPYTHPTAILTRFQREKKTMMKISLKSRYSNLVSRKVDLVVNITAHQVVIPSYTVYSSFFASLPHYIHIHKIGKCVKMDDMDIQALQMTPFGLWK